MFLEEKVIPRGPVEPAPYAPLLKARDYMRKHGWCQHEISDHRGHVCIIGAIIHTTDCPWERNEAYTRVIRYTGEQSIGYFNDYMCGSQAQAEATMEAAAQ